MDKKTLLLAQGLMSFVMALLMTGFFALLATGPSLAWLKAWASNFVVAWPIAFGLSLLVWKFAFTTAVKLRSRRRV